MTNTRVRRKGRIKADPELIALRERLFTAMRKAGCKADTIKAITVRFWESLSHPDLAVSGLCAWRKGRVYIDVKVDEEVVDTLIHEGAHAFLGPAQGEKYQGKWLDFHCPIFVATQNQIRRYF